MLVEKLSNDKVFIVYRDNSNSSNYYLYGIICTISETTITAGVDTQLSNDTQSGMNISAVVLSSDKVFVAHSYGRNSYLYGMICTISRNRYNNWYRYSIKF